MSDLRPCPAGHPAVVCGDAMSGFYMECSDDNCEWALGRDWNIWAEDYEGRWYQEAGLIKEWNTRTGEDDE